MLRVLGRAGLLAVVALTVVASPASAVTFENTDGITITDGSCASQAGSPAAASPYPSEITVSGVTGDIADLDVTVTGLTHSFPDDVGVLLVGPDGQAVVLMQDTGHDGNVTAVDLTFDDAAPTPLPDNGQIVSGSYKPTVGTDGPGSDCGAATFPAPAPAPGATALSAFDSTDPNGTWKLFVMDDSRVDAGSIAGWSLDINAGTPPVAVDDAYTHTGSDTSLGVPAESGVLANDSDPDGDPLSAALVTGPSHGSLFLDSDGSFTYTPDEDFVGSDTFTYQAGDGTDSSAPATVTITVRAGCDGRPATIVGTAGDDELEGSSGDDVIVGLGGDDEIDAGSGDDVVCGGSGHDEIEGGSDRDHLDGGSGDDELDAGSGEDHLAGGAGNDRLDAGSDDDTLTGGDGADRLRGGGDDDTLTGGDGAPDHCDGDGGDNTLAPDHGCETIKDAT